MSVNVIVSKNKIDCEDLLGKFVDESNYDILINEDTDCYMPALPSDSLNESNIAFKFRKGFFSKEEQERAYIGLREAALPTQNRGLASGPKGEKCGGRDWVTEFQLQIFDLFLKGEAENTAIEVDIDEEVSNIRELYSNVDTTRGLVWLSAKVKADNFKFETWLKNVISLSIDNRNKSTREITKKYISDTTYANQVLSGIAGWFDRYPRIPYGRATSYTQNNFDKFKLAFPFLQSLNRGFKELLPTRWAAQKEAATSIDPAFIVPETVFTTITVNKTFRTACHRDAGDFTKGMSNLLVLSNNSKFTGGYIVFPEYEVAVNVRPGDLLLVNNHEIIHGNTPIICEEGSERISLVCYFREKMLELGSKQYEDLRFNYVESRRKNKEHAMWKPLWNGVSEHMWEHEEWYNYLRANNGEEMISRYHPKAEEVISTLEDLFG